MPLSRPFESHQVAEIFQRLGKFGLSWWRWPRSNCHAACMARRLPSSGTAACKARAVYEMRKGR